MPTTYAPGRYPGTPVLGSKSRHLVSRFSYGVTPALAREVKAAGSAAAWFRAQLAAGADGVAEDGVADWYPDLHLGPAALWKRQVTEVRGGWEVMWDYSRRLLMRRATSPRQVLEVMTEFWEAHLHVPAIGDAQFTWRASYGDVIRRHALGRFDEMLVEAVVHPAMLLFLDAAESTKEHPNENLGRELLELHTVGVGAYTEDDVKASARILTGWHVDSWRSWKASYVADDHWTGPVRVMDFGDANAGADGQELTRRYLTYLAHHPSTARRIARKLAVKFVRDDPSTELVESLAQVYLDHDTAIVPVLLKLVASADFKSSVGAKLRDPSEDVVATHRSLGTVVSPPTDDDSAANSIIWQTDEVGLIPMTWPRPDGQPIDNAPWASPARALASMSVHWAMSGGWWPDQGIDYRTPEEWLPQESVSFRDLVDHLSRTLHGRPSDAGLLEAMCLATDTGPRETVTSEHDVVRWQFHRLLGAMLDHPHHYER